MAKQSSESDDHPKEPPTKIAPGTELLTTQELMAYLSMSRTKIWDLVRRGVIPAFKIGGDYRYRRAEIEAWLETQRFKGGSEEK
jgi:excisionase family DNA binding protein